ncbi:MAG TPA: SDR family oxidoreductase [Marmoricola sp.]|nr:SDR family oxidoreductase [Marmoricola sp.]
MSRPVVVITGGAGGMGLATAKIMGADYHVLITDVDQARLDAAVTALAGLEVSTAVCDVTDRLAVQAAFDQAATLGPVSSVVHTAGLSPLMGSADQIMRVNALGTINVTRAALPLAHEGSAVVNVASIAGHMLPSLVRPKKAFKLALSDPSAATDKLVASVQRGPAKMRPASAYSVSKAFVIWYSAHMAAAFGERGGRIVSVSPGSFDTPMGRLEEKSGSAKLVEFAALKRFGRPEEVAEVLAFCAGPKPGYLTGVDILVDGGTQQGLTLRGMLSMARG